MKKLTLMVICFIAVNVSAQDAAKRSVQHIADSLRNEEARAGAKKNPGSKTETSKDDDINNLQGTFLDISAKTETSKNDDINNADIKKMIKKYGQKAYDKACQGKIWLGMGKDLCFYAIQDQQEEHYSYTTSGTVITWTFWHTSGSLVFKNNKLAVINE